MFPTKEACNPAQELGKLSLFGRALYKVLSLVARVGIWMEACALDLFWSKYLFDAWSEHAITSDTRHTQSGGKFGLSLALGSVLRGRRLSQYERYKISQIVVIDGQRKCNKICRQIAPAQNDIKMQGVAIAALRQCIL